METTPLVNKKGHLRRRKSGYVGFPEDVRNVVQKKYGNAVAHIKDLYDTAKKSVDALADCAEELCDMKSKKDSLIIQKGKVDDSIKLLKTELNELKDDSNELKHKIQVCEKEEMTTDKLRKKLETDIQSYLARIVLEQPKREKLTRKHSKKLAKNTESDNDK